MSLKVKRSLFNHVSKQKPKNLIKHTILLSLVVLLAFTIAMPNQIMAFYLFGKPEPIVTPSILSSELVNTLQDQSIVDTMTPSINVTKPKDATKDYEIIEKRTDDSKTFMNKDGSKTLEYSALPKHYKKDGKWTDFNTKLIPDTKALSNSAIVDLTDANTNTPNLFRASSGDLKAQFKPFNEGFEVQYKDKSFILYPQAARNVKPIKTSSDTHDTITYKNAWQNVDVTYDQMPNSIKETLILKNKNAPSSFEYVVSDGVKLSTHPTIPGALAIKGIDAKEFFIAPLSINVNLRGIISEQQASWIIDGSKVTLKLDENWYKSLTNKDFPIAIDPSFWTDAGGEDGNFKSYKSDGYVCESYNCDPNVGSLMDGGVRRSWRVMFRMPFDQLNGKKVLSAQLHIVKAQRSYWTGYTGWYALDTSWAPCFGFNCMHGPSYTSTPGANTDDWIEIRNTVAWTAGENNPDPQWGGWFIMKSDEGANSYKQLDPWAFGMSIVYDTPTPMASPTEPADKKVSVSTQPTLRVNAVSDPDGEAVEYYYRVSTGSDAETGAVINSGWISSTQWTVPDGILQDGTTYYWHVYSRGTSATGTQTNPNWVRSFKIDLRTGKDSTQAYDNVGPIGIDLATGNATTDISTHSINALGGSIGLSLNYNTPTKSKNGLIGEYWNVAPNYSFENGAPSSSPLLTRNDQDINFDYSTGNPSPGVINNDWFYARWKGYFVAPTSGTYSFGSYVDDAISINVNGQMLTGGCYYGGSPCYGGTITLSAGQAVPITVNYQEATGNGYIKLYVKGPVAEQIIPREWFRTEVQASVGQYGLTGRYYTDDGSRNFPIDNNDTFRTMLVRNDTKLSFNWGGGGVAPGLQSDNFMAKWTGYITVPVDGDYTFGANSDDGVRVKLNNGFLGASQTVIDSWTPTASLRWAPNTTYLKKGEPTAITVEYFEAGGGASFNLKLKGPGLSTSDDESSDIPIKWLTPSANALPNAWQMGVDVDGNVSYERLRVAGNNVILEDSTRSTHEYTWTGSAYKPPLNEDGVLTKNTNNTYTLNDVDGKIYIFDAEGKLTSLTSPGDDRNPSSLKYEYAGDPSRLRKITDGVTDTRYGTLHYKSINEDGNCVTPQGSANAPDGMLCAFKTSDGNVTQFYYDNNKNLTRIEKPGSEYTDFQYDSNGRLSGTRDSVANDAIATQVRDAEDSNLLTELSYDVLGRVSAIKAPAPTSGATRAEHVFDYLNNATQMRVIGTPEPNGFSKKVEYDSLLRTTKETDVANLSSLKQWDTDKDLQLSTTDPMGLKSTTIYDADDRAVENYGSAPSSWYDNTTRLPLPSFTNQIPKTSTGYDEGITGLAVNYHDYGTSSKSLIGAPKRIATNISTTNTTEISRAFGANPADLGMSTNWGMRMTGKMKLPTAGNWSFRIASDNGVRVYIDDQLVLNDWNDGINRSHPNFTYNNTVAGSVHRVTIEYYHTTGDASFTLYATPPGASETANVAQYFTPNYGLTTSQTAYDSVLGDVTTKINYSKPEYGLVDNTILDPTGVNLQTNSTYETPGTGYLRQTSKTLPGGGTTAYQHYSKTGSDSLRDNPCTTAIESIHQGGFVKGKVEADPDGAGPKTSRTSDSVYNASGEIVATRYNADPWTCTEYDIRGRVVKTIIPQLSQYQPARTITNNYAFGNNSLITSTTDSTGTIVVENDLLGRTIKYIDAYGNVTNNTYNNRGLLISSASLLGNQEYIYDQYDRLTDQKLDGVTYASVTYDQYGNTDNVTYPAAGQQKVQYSRDTLGRTNGLAYAVATGSSLGPNVINNASFEQSSGTPAIPTNWTSNNWGTNTALLSYENTGRTDGKSVKAEITSYTDGDAKWMHTPITVSGNTGYVYTDYYKSNAWTNVLAQITHQDDSVTWMYLGGNNAASTWTQGSYSFTTPSTAKKVSVARIIDSVGWVQIDDVDVHQTAIPSSVSTISDSVTYSVSGDIRSGTENGTAKTYSYDNAGRLTGATIGNNTYGYEFGTADPTCNTYAGNNTNAGKNGNRSKSTINGQATTYCYNAADQLITTSDSKYSNLEYDNRGNATRVNASLYPVYDASDRSRGIEEYNNSGNGRAVYYERDAQDRISSRFTNNIVNWDWQATGTVLYGFTGGGDTPDFTTDVNGVVQEKYLLLPGDVLMTVRPQQTGTAQKTYSLPNLHDDIFATTNGNGELASTHITGPFGEPVTGQTNPTNTAAGTTFAWVGQHEKITETTFSAQLIQMGARVYVPGLGRFLSVDPVEGGTDNNYVYANDPVNESDLTGRCLGPLIFLFAACMTGLGAAVSMAGGGLGGGSGAGISRGAGNAVKVVKSTSRVGSKRQPLMDRKVQNSLGNKKATINKRQYTAHAQNAMQNAGIYPSSVENAIRFGYRTKQVDKNKYYDSMNNITVIVNSKGGVVTTYWGGKR